MLNIESLTLDKDYDLICCAIRFAGPGKHIHPAT
jgi:hypothetical protein